VKKKCGFQFSCYAFASFAGIKTFLFLLKTASESQIKELLMNIDRAPNDALEDWLPSQDEFDQFARRFSERRSTWTLSTSDDSGGKTKNTR